MDSKKIAGGLAVGFVSVIVLGIILTFVVFCGGDSQTETTEGTAADVAESQTADTVEYETESEAPSEEITEETEGETTEDVSESAAVSETQQETADSSSFYGTWKPIKAEDGMTGEEIGLAEAFGNDFFQLENSLTLSEDGTFTLVLGTMKSEDEGKGTYTAEGDSLAVTYDNGKSDIFKLEKDGNGNIIYILVPRYNFTVYFERG